jgi:hypothetical protein
MPPKVEKQKTTKAEVKAKPTAAPSESSAQPSTKPSVSTVTKPDGTAYNAEQDALKKEIDDLQAKLVSGLFPRFGCVLSLGRMRSKKRSILVKAAEPMRERMLSERN